VVPISELVWCERNGRAFSCAKLGTPKAAPS
jgi:hypothetical protein